MTNALFRMKIARINITNYTSRTEVRPSSVRKDKQLQTRDKQWLWLELIDNVFSWVLDLSGI